MANNKPNKNTVNSKDSKKNVNVQPPARQKYGNPVDWSFNYLTENPVQLNELIDAYSLSVPSEMSKKTQNTHIKLITSEFKNIKTAAQNIRNAQSKKRSAQNIKEMKMKQQAYFNTSETKKSKKTKNDINGEVVVIKSKSKNNRKKD